MILRRAIDLREGDIMVQGGQHYQIINIEMERDNPRPFTITFHSSHRIGQFNLKSESKQSIELDQNDLVEVIADTLAK